MFGAISARAVRERAGAGAEIASVGASIRCAGRRFVVNYPCMKNLPENAAKYLAAFDLDGTLAELGSPVTEGNVALLKRLAHRAQIVLSSGKPTYYLCGFARQLGIADAVLIGENGCAMQFGVSLPPAQNTYFTSSERAVKQLDFARRAVPALFDGNIWCQPNEIMFTPFPTSEEQFVAIRAFNAAHAAELDALDVYEHCDSFDYVPHGVNKRTALENLAARLGVPAGRVIAVGDGVNDYPMFECAGISVGIHLAQPERAGHDFPSLEDALRFLISVTEKD